MIQRENKVEIILSSKEIQKNNLMKTDNIKLPSQEIWCQFSEVEKAQFLLNSNRLLDSEAFLNEYRSWEQPDLADNKDKTVANTNS